MGRVPPSRGRDEGGATHVIVFEETKGTKSSTYRGRSIARIRMRAIDRSGRIVDPPRYLISYGGRHLQIFRGTDFPYICDLVVLRKDTIAMPDLRAANRAAELKDWFAFLRDQT